MLFAFYKVFLRAPTYPVRILHNQKGKSEKKSGFLSGFFFIIQKQRLFNISHILKIEAMELFFYMCTSLMYIPPNLTRNRVFTHY